MEDIVYKKLLFTHDGSHLDSAALPHAIRLARICASEVIILHVTRSVEQEMSFISSPDADIS